MPINVPQFTPPRESPDFWDYLKQGLGSGIGTGLSTAISAPIKDISQAYFIEGPRLEQQQKQFEAQEGRLGAAAESKLRADWEAKRLERERKTQATAYQENTKIYNRFMTDVVGPAFKIGPEALVKDYERRLESQEISVSTGPGQSQLGDMLKRMNSLKAQLEAAATSQGVQQAPAETGDQFLERVAKLNGQTEKLWASMQDLGAEIEKPESSQRGTDTTVRSTRYRNPARIELARFRLRHDLWQTQMLTIQAAKDLAAILLPHQPAEHSVFKAMEAWEQRYKANEPVREAERTPTPRRPTRPTRPTRTPTETPAPTEVAPDADAEDVLANAPALFVGLGIGENARYQGFNGQPNETLSSSARGRKSISSLPKALGARLVTRTAEFGDAQAKAQDVFNKLLKPFGVPKEVAVPLAEAIRDIARNNPDSLVDIQKLLTQAMNFTQSAPLKEAIMELIGEEEGADYKISDEVKAMLGQTIKVGAGLAVLRPRSLHKDFHMESGTNRRLKASVVADSLTFVAEKAVWEVAGGELLVSGVSNPEGLEVLLNQYKLTLYPEKPGMLYLGDRGNRRVVSQVDRFFADLVNQVATSRKETILSLLLGGHSNDTFRREMFNDTRQVLLQMISNAEARASGRGGQR